ncbi:hypothetical protein BKA62DRAFT_727046 [Auriculariales sp. MPI-PUGE-AT-0066]|nr:hypothetical protein BKA62DRAFT_727046 [Auriculariales sp. MPI-PUGE-AT-0066]
MSTTISLSSAVLSLVEITEAIFWLVSLKELVAASHVRRNWRRTALSHPAYWRTILLDSPRLGDRKRFAHRLEYGQMREIKLYIRLLDTDRRILDVLSLLREAIPRAKELHIGICSVYRKQIDEVLAMAVPHLQVFEIYHHSAHTPELLPSFSLGRLDRILTGSAGPSGGLVLPHNLRKIKLTNILLPPASCNIAAFASAEDVEFIHATETLLPEFPCYLFDIFPNVKRLNISAGAVEFPQNHITSEFWKRFANLDFLHLRFRTPWLNKCFEHLPITQIADVRIVAADAQVMQRIVDSHMRDRFDLEFREFKEEEGGFDIVVRDLATDRVCRLFESKELYGRDSTNTNTFFRTEFCGEVQHLHIQTSLWSLIAPWMPAFPTVTKLTVDIDNKSPEVVHLPIEVISLLNLQTILLKSTSIHGFVRVHADDVVDFANRFGLSALQLEVSGVLLDDLTSATLQRFTAVIVNHPW